MHGSLVRRMFCLPVTIALAVGFVAHSQAQNRDVSTLFPDPNQVKADYPNDPERYAAFFALSVTLNATASRPLSRAAYTKSFDYEGAYNGIETLHMQQGMRTQAYKDWAALRDKLVTDRTFLHSVLEKYHVADLPKVARPAPAPTIQPGAAPGNPYQPPQYRMTPEERFHRLFIWTMPLVPVSWIAMYVLPLLLLRRSGTTRLLAVSQNPPLPGAPSLPESLHVVQLPGVRYAVKTFSGLVLDKQTTFTTTTTTSTTSGQTTSHSTTHRTDVMRVRTPELREATWTFTERSGVNIFPGQIVSAVARPMKDDFSEFLASYNHNTGEVVAAGGLDNANRTGGILAFLAQPASCIAGTLGFLIVICYFLTTPPYVFQFGLDMGGFIVLLFSAFCSLTVAFFLTHWLRYKVMQRRNALFLSRYGPQYRQFFEQSTPALQKRFGGQ
ncbi:MAG TPA: hypothetical protein VGR14_01420 [Verrucomicrobiae bacterium]|nr:hypothetical protein [Verrucomicrobiae bacterium]